jgi:hypothetical protein
MGHDTKTYWLTVSRNVTLTLAVEENIRGLNLAAVNPTTVQVSNCRFLALNK